MARGRPAAVKEPEADAFNDQPVQDTPIDPALRALHEQAESKQAPDAPALTPDVEALATGPAAPVFTADGQRLTGAIKLPRNDHGHLLIDGVPCQHIASCRLHEEGTAWARPDLRQWQFPKALPDHPGAVFYKTRFKDMDMGMKEAYVVYSIEEKHLYRII